MTTFTFPSCQVGAQRGLCKFRCGLTGLLITMLAACGGADNTEKLSSERSPEPETIAAQREGARLNSEELAQIAKTGVIPKAFSGRSLSGAGEAKYSEARTPVFRFFNTRTSAHFYTTSTVERDRVLSTAPYMSLDGPAFDASGTDIPGLSPVHRFYNTQTGVHFYTISEAERAHIAATLPQFTYEGIAYHASTLPGTGYKPLYRFFYAAKGFHFYTASSAEANTIQASMPQYVAEGIGYYVLDNDWQTPAVPHTGVNSGQCYSSGFPTLVPCAGVDATNLNSQQDGHRSGINTMSFSGVPVGINIFNTYPYTSCVRDNVTGLVWEGKEASGARSGTNAYSNLGVNLSADTGSYIAAVNASKLCGVNDWRLPTAEELQSIVDYSATTAGVFRPGIFVNTQSGDYWTATTDAAAGGKGWFVGFNAGNVSNGGSLTNVRYVRLVHGPKWAGQRYMTSTQTYAGDAANNAVIDRKTGLTWRRCVEGQAWNGSACVGTAGGFTLDQALARARDQAGWRMPNAKELVSLNDPGRVSPALDTVAFPGLPGINSTWTSTPYVQASSNAWAVDFNQGYLFGLTRTNLSAVRLVRSIP
ncbi:DUF1566 domain-containing protein [Hydrogenophaga sp. RWCD_12]|uniref:DUF1566 domain-containing protein n=1 Tax=Hydrogenophaga sp. RWCD_12 TaxID=3391190 RepID=UPI003984DFE7